VSINPQINETLYRKFCKHERCAYWRGIPFPEQRRKREAAPTLATQPAEAQIPKPDGSDAHRTCDAQRTTSPSPPPCPLYPNRSSPRRNKTVRNRHCRRMAKCLRIICADLPSRGGRS
jgi:hypothetical protein